MMGFVVKACEDHQDIKINKFFQQETKMMAIQRYYLCKLKIFPPTFSMGILLEIEVILNFTCKMATERKEVQLV